MKHASIKLEPFEPFHQEMLRNSKVKKLYDDLEPEFMVIETMIKMRKAAGLSQAAMAKKLKTKQSAVSRFESGTANPTLLFLYKTARALGVKLKISVVPARGVTR